MTYFDDWYSITKGKLKNANRDELGVVISLAHTRIERYRAELKACEDILAELPADEPDGPDYIEPEDDYELLNEPVGGE